MTEKAMIWLIVVSGLALMSLIWIVGGLLGKWLSKKNLEEANRGLIIAKLLAENNDDEDIKDTLRNFGRDLCEDDLK